MLAVGHLAQYLFAGVEVSCGITFDLFQSSFEFPDLFVHSIIQSARKNIWFKAFYFPYEDTLRRELDKAKVCSGCPEQFTQFFTVYKSTLIDNELFQSFRIINDIIEKYLIISFKLFSL